MPFWEAPDRFNRELADFARAARSPQPARPNPLWPMPRALMTDGAK